MRKFIPVIILITIFAAGAAFSEDAIVSNEVIVPKEADTYMEVRHIVLKGTNEEIGKAIGDISQKWLDVKLRKYLSPVYARANREYIRENYPVLSERVKGVARSYGVSPDNDTYVTNALPYDGGPLACSAVFFPASATTNSHNIAVRNNDFYICSMWEMVKVRPPRNDHKLFSRCFVMEMYPSKGYSSVVLGSFDLLNGALDGVNSEGLFAAALVDFDCPKSEVKLGETNHSGINALQLVRFLLDTCATAEEAKIAILNNKIWFQKFGMHFIVGDRSGNSFIFEVSPKNFDTHITENMGKPQVMTNHPVYAYPDIRNFPRVSKKAVYRTFNRYRTLDEYIKNHKEKFSPSDTKEAISLVWGNTTGLRDGTFLPMPVRTLWTVFYDLDDGSVEVKFYLKDGPKDPSTGRPELILSSPYYFTLETPA